MLILMSKDFRAQELCESRGGRPGLPVPNSPCGLYGRKAILNLNLSSLPKILYPVGTISFEEQCKREFMPVRNLYDQNLARQKRSLCELRFVCNVTASARQMGSRVIVP